MMSHMIVFIMLIVPVLVFSAELHVPVDYAIIADAMSAAASGDVVVLAPGEYSEAVTLAPGVSFVSASGDPHDTIVYPGDYGTALTVILSNDSHVRGITFGGGLSLFGKGADISYSEIGFVDCTFSGNQAMASRGAGVEIKASEVTFEGCEFSGNVTAAGGYGGGCWVEYALVDFTSCSFSSNHAKYGGGLGVGTNSRVHVSYSSFSGNEAEVGAAINYLSITDIYLGSSVSSCSISGNHASERAGGIAVGNDQKVELIDSSIINNTSGNMAGGIYLEPTGWTIAFNTDFSENQGATGNDGYVNGIFDAICCDLDDLQFYISSGGSFVNDMSTCQDVVGNDDLSWGDLKMEYR